MAKTTKPRKKAADPAPDTEWANPDVLNESPLVNEVLVPATTAPPILTIHVPKQFATKAAMLEMSREVAALAMDATEPLDFYITIKMWETMFKEMLSEAKDLAMTQMLRESGGATVLERRNVKIEIRRTAGSGDSAVWKFSDDLAAEMAELERIEKDLKERKEIVALRCKQEKANGTATLLQQSNRIAGGETIAITFKPS